MGGRDLDVFHVPPTVGPLVFDPHVRELHAVLVRGELVLVRPFLNLVLRPVGPAVAVRTIAIPLLEEALVITLQLVIEDDPIDARPLPLETFCTPEVGAVQVGVVRQLAAFGSARIEDGGSVHGRCTAGAVA
jgi:hypothetical protein